jgi:hypothetical protein
MAQLKRLINMTPTQFDQALAQHPKMPPNSLSVQAARLVLVNGATAYRVAQSLGMAQSTVSRAVARILAPHCPSCTCNRKGE